MCLVVCVCMYVNKICPCGFFEIKKSATWEVFCCYCYYMPVEKEQEKGLCLFFHCPKKAPPSNVEVICTSSCFLHVQLSISYCRTWAQNKVYIYMYIWGICHSWDTMDLDPKSYASVTDSDTACVIAVQAYTRVTVIVCEDTLPWCCRVVFFSVKNASPMAVRLGASTPSTLLSEKRSGHHLVRMGHQCCSSHVHQVT